MAIAPELLPGLMEDETVLRAREGGVDPFEALALGAPERFGDVQPQGPEPLLGDLYPEDEDEYDKLVQWCQSAFNAAESHRRQYDEKWSRYYRLYRSHVERTPGDWHSTVFIPICFWIVETITPRLVAQLPKFVTQPVGPDDVKAAKTMETLLDWATEQSGLYTELVKAFKSSLKYGTGILKTFHRQDLRRARKHLPIEVPLMGQENVPVLDELGQPMIDLNGEPIVETREVEFGRLPMGTQSQVYQYTAYDGPAAECIDIFNFWVAPESHDIDSARYVIHRTFREMSYVEKLVKEGIYRWPSNMTPEDITDVSDDPALKRLSSIGLGSGTVNDPTRRAVELLEFWTNDGRKMVMVNRKALLQVVQNPFDHSEKPFIRIVDYLQEHEFWGVGEIEPIEGMQDVHNAIVNSRIDNLRLVLNSMFVVNTQHVEDLRDFRSRPGGIIRVSDPAVRPEEAVHRIDMGDVTSGAFNETELIERTVEKVTGVSAYQMGLDSPSLNDTATGVAIIQEQGASRFGLKSKLVELMGLKRLGRHYGSILQQFTTEERVVRLTGPDGQMNFETFSPEALQGALDFDIEAESTTQSQTMRQEQKMNLLGLVAQFAPQGVLAALGEVLDAFGIKDKEKFLYGDPEMNQQLMQMQMMQQQQAMMSDPSMMGMDPSMQDPSMQDPSMAPQGALPPSNPAPDMNPAEGTFGDMNADRMLAELAAQYQQGGQL